MRRRDQPKEPLPARFAHGDQGAGRPPPTGAEPIFEAYIARAVDQSQQAWDDDYTADAVNADLRASFVVEPAAP